MLMKTRSFKIIALLIGFSILFSCRVKRCASFENQDKEYKLKYDRHGRVKK
jgi:hypothetical protein